MTADEEIETDAALLKAYSAGRSEEAFRRLVERHLPTVWNTARRLVNGDTAMAEDVSQEVFSHLARRAATLAPQTVLGGWLYRHTCFTASKAVRSAVRRRAREYTAATDMNASASDPWPEIAPHLDAALQSLSTADRNAVVLRFFEKQDFRSIGAALGTSEDGARMKTSRAVEKLRSLLGRRGTVLTAAVLVSLLAERAVAAPPAGMAGQLASTAFKNAGRTGAGALTILWAAMMRRRAVLAGGAMLLMTGSSLWYWNTHTSGGEKPVSVIKVPPPRPVSTESTPPPFYLKAEVTVRFMIMPEAAAVLLLNDRWTYDHDDTLLETILKTVDGKPDGTVIAQTLSGECISGQRVLMERIEETPTLPAGAPENNGTTHSTEPKTRKAGSIAEVELVIGEDKTCDLNLALEHHFAPSAKQHWSASLNHPEESDPQGVTFPEFRCWKGSVQMILKPGSTRLAGSSLLPPLPDSDPRAPGRYLLAFVSVNLTPPP